MEITITLIIVIMTVLVSLGGFNNRRIIDDLVFYPPAIAQRKQYYRFITHGFIHADFIHLGFNMLALYSFGQLLEKDVYGWRCYFGDHARLFYLLLYLGGLIFASLPDFFRYKDSYHFRSLGASGAVSAVVFSCIVFLPTSGIGIIFIPGVRIPGYIFAILYLVLSSYLDKKGGGRINHNAHFWGAIFGLVYTAIIGYFFSKINLWDNFWEQIRASRPFLPNC